MVCKKDHKLWPEAAGVYVVGKALPIRSTKVASSSATSASSSIRILRTNAILPSCQWSAISVWLTRSRYRYEAVLTKVGICFYHQWVSLHHFTDLIVVWPPSPRILGSDCLSSACFNLLEYCRAKSYSFKLIYTTFYLGT